MVIRQKVTISIQGIRNICYILQIGALMWKKMYNSAKLNVKFNTSCNCFYLGVILRRIFGDSDSNSVGDYHVISGKGII